MAMEHDGGCWCCFWFAELLLVMPVSACDAFPVTRVLTLMLVLLMLMLHCIGLPVSLLVLGIAIASGDVL